jgi:hypothetical protein
MPAAHMPHGLLLATRLREENWYWLCVTEAGTVSRVDGGGDGRRVPLVVAK